MNKPLTPFRLSRYLNPMKINTLAVLVSFVLPAAVGHADRLPDLKSVDLSAATATFKGKKLTLDNVRAISGSTDLGDFVRGQFKFDKATQSFLPKNFTIYQEVGVAYTGTSNDDYFVIDVTTPLVLTGPTGKTYQENETYTLTTSGTPYTISLPVGAVLSYTTGNNTDQYRAVVHGPDGVVLLDDRVEADTGIISGTLPVLQAGAYTLTITPINDRQVTLDFRFGNANRQTLKTVSDGDYISTSLREDLRDYYKYRIHLNAGDELAVDDPSSSNSHLVLLNSRSEKIVDNTGLPVIHVSDDSSDYYLFIDDRSAQGVDYSGYVSITPGVGSRASRADTGAHVGKRHTVIKQK